MLSENSLLVDFKASSKKQVLDALSKIAEKEINVSHRIILDNLIKREKPDFLIVQLISLYYFDQIFPILLFHLLDFAF